MTVGFDFMGELRTWLRTQPDLAALHNGNVVFNIRWPTTAADRKVALPAVRIYRLGGGLVPGETDLWAPRVGLAVWAADFNTADQLAVALETVLHQTWQTAITPAAYLASAETSGAVFAPDPDSGLPRYDLTASLVLQQTA